eukprot:109580-Chlamydomonas_euryale.AAC.1
MRAQGLTLQKVRADVGKVFVAGQVYVALSRTPSSMDLQVLNVPQLQQLETKGCLVDVRAL